MADSSTDQKEAPGGLDALEAAAEAVDARQLLTDARRAQASADRAVAELSSIKRTITDTPRLIDQRREDVERARQALAKAEAQLESAKKVLKVKQAEAGRAVEAAATAQQALARALTDGHDIGDEGAAIIRAGNRYESLDPMDRTAKFGDLSRDYAPAPTFTKEDIVAYLANRDLLCPSCGMQLRGVKQTNCPGCRMELSLPTLKAVRSRGATAAIWAVRLLALGAMLLSAYLAVAIVLDLSVLGCGIGGTCDMVAKSGYAYLFGVPVAGLGALLFAGIAAVTWFVNVGRSDQTRARAWSMLTALSVFAAGVGVWHLIVQAAILRGFCPPCALVSLMGIALAVLVLMRAPINREEKLPEEAVGSVKLPRAHGLQLIGGAMTVVVLAGVMQAALNRNASSVPQMKQRAELRRQQAQREAERRANAMVMSAARQPGDPAEKTGGKGDHLDIWEQRKRDLLPDSGKPDPAAKQGLLVPAMTHRPDENGEIKPIDDGADSTGADPTNANNAATQQADAATTNNQPKDKGQINLFPFAERFNMDGMTRHLVNKSDPVTIPGRQPAAGDKGDGDKKDGGETDGDTKTEGDATDKAGAGKPDAAEKAPTDKADKDAKQPSDPPAEKSKSSDAS